MKVVSLFSGAGGLDLGFVRAGYRIIFANDVLMYPVMTYAKNIGLRVEVCRHRMCSATSGTAILGDVKYIDFNGLASEDIDVVVGGPPCQDFSIVRGSGYKRRGIEVERGRLYIHFIRAIATVKPKVFLFENVPGLISSNKGVAYSVIIDDFRNLNIRWSDIRMRYGIDGDTRSPHGYEIVFSGTVDFSHLGVPQRRRRLIVIGVRRDLVRSKGDLMDISFAIHSTIDRYGGLFKKYPLTTMEVFEGRILPDVQDRYREVMLEWEGVWNDVGNDVAMKWKENVWSRMTFDVVRDYLAINGVRNWSEGELEEAWRQHRLVLDELGYTGRRVCSEPVHDLTCVNHDNRHWVVDRMRRIPPGENIDFVKGTVWYMDRNFISTAYRRIHPLKPSYTILAHGGGGMYGYHYERKRASLTLRERARLQTFPDEFIFVGGIDDIRAQIGEAIPPLASNRIAIAISEVLKLVK